MLCNVNIPGKQLPVLTPKAPEQTPQLASRETQCAVQSGLNSKTPQQYHQTSSAVGPSLGQCDILQYLHWPFFALLWRFITVESYLIHGWGWGDGGVFNDYFMGT